MDLTLKAIIEGILFVFGEEGVSLDALSDTLVMDKENVKALCEELAVQYQDEEHGFELHIINEQYKLISKIQVHDYVQRILDVEKTRQLSQSALETLAIIAYRQPITRIEIEEIRGVGCDMMLKRLQSQDLIQEAGRLDTPGKPILYQVTERFLDLFKLMNLQELPNLPSYEEEETLEHQLFE